MTAGLSAALAAGVAIGATVAIERFGGQLGGLLATLPTTVVPASLGFAAVAQTPDDLLAALGTVPVGMLVNAGFLWTWRVGPSLLPDGALNTRLAAMSALSLAAWAVAAVICQSALSGLDSAQAIWQTGAILTLVQAGVGVAACWSSPPAPRGSKSVGLGTLLSRGALAGLAIAVAVVLSRIGGPVMGGLASVFPAIFLTTMVSLWLAQGEAVPAGAVGPMMLGSTSVSAYALLAALILPVWGLTAGAVAAWLAAIALTSVPAWWFLGWRRAALAR